MRRAVGVGLAVTAMLVLAPGAGAQYGLPTYTYVVIISEPDTLAQHVTLFTALEGTVQGQACNGLPVLHPDHWCDYYTYVSNPSIQASILLVVNGDIGPTIEPQLQRNNPAYRRLVFSRVLPRDELIRRGIVAARNYSDRYMVLQAGDTLPVDLLGSFLPFQ